MSEFASTGLFAKTVRRELGPETDWRDVLAGFDCVVHLAATAHEAAERLQAAQDHASILRVNALGTERLARDAAAVGVRRFIFLSTIGVHGDENSGRPFTEDSPLAPRSLYASSKLEAEVLLRRIGSETGLEVTILRPTLVYGPGNRGNMLRLLKILERRLPLPLAMAEGKRSLTYVGNLVSVVALAIAHPRAADTFIVCDERPISTVGLLRDLGGALGPQPMLFPIPVSWLRFAARVTGYAPTARRLLGSLEADCGKLHRVLGWRPPFGTTEGLARTAAWYKELRAE